MKEKIAIALSALAAMKWKIALVLVVLAVMIWRDTGPSAPKCPAPNHDPARQHIPSC